jgi:hypothetical protein
MAILTPKALVRAAATTTTTTTLYTVPASTTTIITNITVVNTSATAQTFTLSLDGVSFATTVSLAANSQYDWQGKQVLATTKTIQGGASATSVTFHISGVEIA